MVQYKMSSSLDAFGPVLILIGFAIVMVVGALLVGRLLRPKNPTILKNQAYECGENPTGNAWANFNVRFYVLALVFIIFDVEGALLFPVAAVFKDFLREGNGGLALVSILFFIFVLFLGVVYCWSRGDFDWVKSYHKDTKKA